MMMEQQGTDPVSKEFSSAFSAMAFDTLTQQMPELLDSVVTFKILEIDPDDDFGVGSFVLMYQGIPLYIPVILQNSELKPLELMYYKEADMFLPLSEDWVKQLVSSKQQSYGDAVPRPQDVPTDVNLEELITPPRTGRYVYASYNMEEGTPVEKLAKLREQTALTFEKIRDALPAEVFNKLSETMGKDIRILNKFAAEQKEHLLADKEVLVQEPEPDALSFFTLDSPKEEIEKLAQESDKEGYGDYMTQIVDNGFVVKDNRDPEKIGKNPIQIHGRLTLEQVTKSDFFQLFGKNGRVHHGFYFAKPLELFCSDDFNSPVQEHRGYGEFPQTVVPKRGHFISRDKEIFKLYNSSYERPIVGRIEENEDYRKEVLEKIFSGAKDRPSVGEFGVFVNMETSPYTVSEPTYIKEVMDNDGVTRVAISKYKPWRPSKEKEPMQNSWEHFREFEKKNPDQVWLSDLKTAIQKFDKSGIVALNRKEFKWLPLKGEDYNSVGCCRNFVTSPKFIEDYIKTQALERGGASHRVIKDDVGMFSIDGKKASDRRVTVTKLACELEMPASDALEILKQADENKRCDFFVFEKTATIFAAEQPPPPVPAPGQTTLGAGAPMAGGSMVPQMGMGGPMGPDGSGGISGPMDPTAGGIPEINPMFMNAAQQLDNQGLFNISTLLSLNKRQLVRNIFKDYFGTFKDALDALGRILYTLWVKEPNLVKELSLEGYQEIEDNVRLLFKGLGDLLLTTSKDSEILTT
jgi:hypothetical protein